ncbi:hypothetical protein A2Z33_07230 [Candidatus Gottesmanbacteria bacterium RBG_16_52_11]|uniref:Transcriptional repressor PaaX-like central Cas2-like domain-containing protein n=1 Tax=Candidatus Gottesmanbacteria bacterium RBG_16_52_11 TaxID=1798374 RepID=A0A1F5YY36_9BACT|nr:MAG: hypothetical protein A2Z33_07230 [Candidatus Gottesmanbacteria bacterium RBG_16_52_11]
MPDQEIVVRLCESLIRTSKAQSAAQQLIRTQRILQYFGMGITIAAAFLAPRSATGIGKSILSDQRDSEIREWEKYNTGYLKQTLRRLEKQKLIERVRQDGREVLKISATGRTKVLYNALESLGLTSKKWDGFWRIVMYDIENSRKKEQYLIRRLFRKLGMYPLQKSVYLFPFQCFDEIEYIRSLYGLTGKVIYIVAKTIENDGPYREFFGV